MNNQIKSNIHYSKLVNKKNISLTEISGRYLKDKGSEKFIILDIQKKIKIKKNVRVLDIGCGYGELTKHLVKFSSKKSFNLTLCDIPEIIKKLKKKYKIIPNLNFLSGNFPNIIMSKQNYNRIIIYSVIQYSNSPRNFLKKAVSLLLPGGKLLLGDIPNIDKKYRFLKSDFGKKFEKKRKSNLDLKKLTKNYKSFKKFTKQNLKINDKFLEWIKNYFKKEKKYRVRVLTQPKKLPYCYTREDVLIEKYK